MAKKSKNSIQLQGKRPGKKKAPFWFYIILVLIPVVFFILLEFSLRIFNYGLDFEEFVVASDYHKDKLFLNPDIPYKYFYNISAAPSILPDGFDLVKKDNAFRVFVLGGSSTAGWPYVPNASFSRHIKRKLELLYSDNTIEVINMGISAINSYTIRDFVPGILEQKPDLILIYAGHNEYYGALGAGSTVQVGYSRTLVNFYLQLRNFRTTQLLQNVISWFYGLFASSEKIDATRNETLMSRMIGESLIPLDSDIYNIGIEQFEGNMDDILNMFEEKNIPVIIGNLTCNLKDQKPFVSVKENNEPSADEMFNNAKRELQLNKKTEAAKLFLQAKELDALRFRAPKKINEIISSLASKYKLPLVNIDSLFSVNSPDSIVGYNLTVDHLHPTITGYRMIGDEFLKEMEKQNLMPEGKRVGFSIAQTDSILKAEFPFTKLDSTIAEMQVIILTGQYPFVPKGTKNVKMMNYKIANYVDSVALQVINKDIKWETGHAILSDYYFNKGDYDKCVKELEAVIAERPYFDIPYKDVISKLVDKGIIDKALPFLEKLHKVKKDYFSYKWLGQVKLKLNEYEEAKKYLVEAVKFKEADSQTWYNLGGAHYLSGDNRSALAALEKSLKLNPQNKLAQQFYNQLKPLVNN